MITPVSESEFRSDKVAVEKLTEFLSSKEGMLFQGLLRWMDPMERLAAMSHGADGGHAIRDEAIAEKANPDSLLGMSKQHRRITNMLERCMVPAAVVPDTKPQKSQHSQVLKTMQAGPPEE